MRSVRVELGERSYDVRIGRGLLSSLGGLVREAVGSASRAFVVADQGLPRDLVDRVIGSLRGAGLDAGSTDVAPVEACKTIETVRRVLREMAERRMERGDVLVALGGGLTGDVGGFCAATYRRGIAFVQCPTTLLAMVDASVGGKTGVNLETSTGLKKNVVGAFWQPALVVADVEALKTLPARQMRSGMAECIKHAMISRCVPTPDEGLWRWTAENLDVLLAGDGARLEQLVERNVRVKAGVVAADEREEARAGGRALLNLGHTFGHALEVIRHLTPDGDPASAPLHHGEAVAVGLVAAAGAAEKAGMVDGGFVERTREVVEGMGIRTRLAGLPREGEILETMSHDKKVAGGRLRVVLPSGEGRAEVVEDPAREWVATGLRAIGAVG